MKTFKGLGGTVNQVFSLDSVDNTILIQSFDNIPLVRQQLITILKDNNYFNDKQQAVGSILAMGIFKK